MAFTRLGFDGYGVRRAGSFAGKTTEEIVVVVRNAFHDIAVLTQRQIIHALTTGTAFSVLTVPIGHVVTLTDNDITV